MSRKFIPDEAPMSFNRGFINQAELCGHVELKNTGVLVPVEGKAALTAYLKKLGADQVRAALRSDDHVDVIKDYLTSHRFLTHFMELRQENMAAVYRELTEVVKAARFQANPQSESDITTNLKAAYPHTRGFVDAEFVSTGQRKRGDKASKAQLLDPHAYKGHIDCLEELEDLIHRCMSDSPQYKFSDLNTYRVFSARNVLDFAKNYENEKDQKNMIEDFVKEMAANNGYRQRIVATESRRKKLLELLDTFPNFKDVTQHLLEQMRAWQYRQSHRRGYEPILLNGPHGCGKTAYVQSLAKALGTDYSFVNIAATSTGGVLMGTSEKWSNGQPGLLVKALSRGRYASPLVLLDEIDKIQSGDSRYPVTATLLAMLEPETSKNLRDEFNMIEFDASLVFYIATCNDSSLLPPPLRSRFKTFNVTYPNPAQRRVIIARRLEQDYQNIEFSHEALVMVSRKVGDLRQTKNLIDQLVNKHLQTQLHNMGQGKAQKLRGKQVISEHTARQVLGAAENLFSAVEI